MTLQTKTVKQEFDNGDSIVTISWTYRDNNYTDIYLYFKNGTKILIEPFVNDSDLIINLALNRYITLYTCGYTRGQKSKEELN